MKKEQVLQPLSGKIALIIVVVLIVVAVVEVPLQLSYLYWKGE